MCELNTKNAFNPLMVVVKVIKVQYHLSDRGCSFFCFAFAALFTEENAEDSATTFYILLQLFQTQISRRSLVTETFEVHPNQETKHRIKNINKWLLEKAMFEGV